jgi:hypothetical protein
MQLHQIKRLLHVKRKNYQNEETTHRMGENLSSYALDKGLIIRIYKDPQKLKTKRTN